MAKGLKGITLEVDGNTTKLVSALGDVTKASKDTQSELRGIESLLKLDPTNTDLVAQKQVVLGEAIAATEQKLETLTEAQRQMAAAGVNINDDKYRDLQREIIATKSKLSSLTEEQANVKKLADSFTTVKDKLAKFANKIPGVSKLTSAFENAKNKIKETAAQSKTLKKVSSAVDGVKNKVSSFVEKVPVLNKLGGAFENIKEKASSLKGHLPAVATALGNVGAAAAKVTANVAKIGFKAMGAAAAGATAAIGALTVKSIQSYAQYEQLAGGVETLFKSSSDTVMNYANNAYKTAGMSANQYMETVTGFSASLLQSMGGDTEAAAAKADLAITDMSDNANKMGTSIESIQTTYQGFAKQNYTMLDNLKLGYGGTKEEMQRLLEDATKLSGVEYDISSYADVVDAIHIVQTEMGITGTTAKEASSTIEGSITSAKSAWENWIGGMANSEADFTQLTDNLVQSVMTVAENLAPRIIETVPRIVEGLGSMVEQLATYVPQLLQGLLPPLLEGISGLITTIVTMLPGLIGTFTGIITQLLPQFINIGLQLITALITGISTAIPQIMAMLPTIIQTMVTALVTNLPLIISAGVMILVNLIQGITNNIPTLITAILDLIPVIVSTVMENLPLIITAGLNLLIALITGIVQAIPQLIAMLPEIINTIITTIMTMLPQIIQAGIQLLNALINGIIQAIPQLIAALPQVISSLINTIIANLPQIISAGIQLLGALISGIIQAIPQLIAALPQVVSAIFDTLKAINWGELGSNIIAGIKDGVVNAAKSLANAVADAAKAALDAAKDFLGIHSPSTVFRDQVGKQMAAGVGLGFTQGIEDEADAMAKSIPTNFDSYISAKAARRQVTNAEAGVGGFYQTVNNYSPKALDPSEAARQTRNATRQMILNLKKGA